MLQWLLEEARAKGTPFDHVVEKVLLVNFGAMHTASGVRVIFVVFAHVPAVRPAASGGDRGCRTHGARCAKLDTFFEETMCLVAGGIPPRISLPLPAAQVLARDPSHP